MTPGEDERSGFLDLGVKGTLCSKGACALWRAGWHQGQESEKIVPESKQGLGPDGGTSEDTGASRQRRNEW